MYGITGYGMQPPEKTFFLATKQSYNIYNTAEKNIDNMKLILETPTVKAYLDNNDNTILLAIRGTKPTIQEDLFADSMIPFNQLSSSDRYKKDKDIINGLLHQYPTKLFDYYLTGHSLGGAITAQLKRDFPEFKNAVVYNSASQPYDYLFQNDKEIKRIYTENDPLYNLGASVFKNKQVLPSTTKGIIPSTFGITKAYDYYQGHALDNFKPLYGLGRNEIKNVFRQQKQEDQLKMVCGKHR